jgi:dihydroorotase
MTAYDLLIQGGELIDPGGGTQGRYDLALRDGKVALIAPAIDAAQAREVLDATGQIVTPGLVDLHTHVYWGATYWGIEADPVAARSGVTTWIDVGSAGAYNWPAFRRFVAETSVARIYALLNLSAIGLTAPTWEFANLDYCDVDLAARTVEANRDLILGIKARIDSNTTRGTGLRPLELARVLADRVELPLMVHIGNGPPSLDELLPLLRPGDILTHCFTGNDMRILTPERRVREDVLRLKEAGLILDIGHGTGSFSYETSEAALEQGLLPDVISSDIHQLSVQGPMFDLPTTLSKFLNLGLSLPEVILRATSNAARAVRLSEPGTLRVGGSADVALFRLESGDYTFYDVQMNARRATTRLRSTATLVSGRVLEARPELPPAIWADLPEHQRSIAR